MYAASSNVHAQQYPAKTIRLITPFATGASFLIGQLVSEGLRETFRQGMVAESRSGGGGSIALETVARSAPDGYTLLVASSTLTIVPIVRPDLKLDAVRDFAPISLIGTIPNLMVVHPSVPAKSIKEFVREARAQPGRLTYGSSGAGTSNHLATELFSVLAKVKMTPVSYKSATLAVIDLVRGDIDMVIGQKTAVAPFLSSAKLRVIAVLTAQRTAALPDVPTAVEQGMPDLVVDTWYGVLAPSGTRTEIIDRLAQEIVRIMKSPEARQVMAKADVELTVSTPSTFAEFIKSDSARWVKVIRDAKLKF
ncbi:MAG: tripartite tricarboxylate transporter substrate binding protein [Betaproteobacteria bacterium]|nr:tripartite tricarboxylate transporter substrate binding protein [Betaproteobacteria bacterium]MBI2294433.1 tripartite tricarboxylate transporter substrate binding protein [Betaproteobacteria bacterium]